MADPKNDFLDTLFDAIGSGESIDWSEIMSKGLLSEREIESLQTMQQLRTPEYEAKSSPEVLHDDLHGETPEPGLPFERLGEYRLLRRIATGGMGEVFLALQEPLGRRVAVKIIRSDREGSLEAEERFRREIEAVTRLRHTNIVTIYGCGSEQGVRYFAMELVAGKGLDEVLREAREREKKLIPRQILGWAIEIAQASECAHQAGVIHRDIKPSNILIMPGGRPMLMDFGIARHLKLPSLTLTGMFRGTVRYASPEQVEGKKKEIDARTDIYSLGVVLYEATTGRVPFEGETTEQVFRQILEKVPVPPRRFNPAISKDLNTIIVKAMEKDPRHRYATMAALAEDLERLLNGEVIKARPAGLGARVWKFAKRNPTTAMLAGALVVLILFLTGSRVNSRLEENGERRRALRECENSLQERDLANALRLLEELHTQAPKSSEFTRTRQAIINSLDEACNESGLEKHIDLFFSVNALITTSRTLAGALLPSDLRNDLLHYYHLLEVSKKQSPYDEALEIHTDMQEKFRIGDRRFKTQHIPIEERTERRGLHEELESNREELIQHKRNLLTAIQAATQHVQWAGAPRDDERTRTLSAGYFQLWKQARDLDRAELVRHLTSLVRLYDRKGLYEEKMNFTACYTIFSSPPGARAHLFRYISHEEVSHNAQMPRLVPVPFGRIPRAGSAPQPLDEGFYLGDPCLAIVDVEEDSPASAAGLQKGDLVLKIGHSFATESLFVANVGAGPARESGVQTYDVIRTLNGSPIKNIQDLASAADPQDGNNKLLVHDHSEARSIIVEFGSPNRHMQPCLPDEALRKLTGIDAVTVDEILRFPAPPGGVNLRLLWAGNHMSLNVPEGVEPGLEVDATAYPLIFDSSGSIGSVPKNGLRSPALAEGSYLLVLRHPGYEDLRLPFLMTFHDDCENREIHGKLIEKGRTPEGFIWVAPGNFISGGDPDAILSTTREKKHLEGFFIAEREVTLGDWLEFVNDSQTLETIEAALQSLRPGTRVFDRFYLPRIQDYPLGYLCKDRHAQYVPSSDFLPSCASMPLSEFMPWLSRIPILGISYFDVEGYLSWLNAKTEESDLEYDLPSEDQWEKAARGADGRFYPWGNWFDWSFTKGRCSRSQHPNFEPVLGFLCDESVYGVRDMAGGVREWTRTRSEIQSECYNAKGSSWVDGKPDWFRCAYKSYLPPRYTDKKMGFRLCVQRGKQ